MKHSGQLRRSPMPQRTTRLKQGALARGTKGFQRSTPMPRSLKPLPPVNKERQARKTAAAGMTKKQAKDIVRARSSGQCEFRFPGVCLGRATNFAHRKPEGQGGLYVPSDLVHSCGHGNNFPGCHRHQEGNRTLAYEMGWLVHREDDHRDRPIWMWYRGTWGKWLLDDRGTAVPAPNHGERT